MDIGELTINELKEIVSFTSKATLDSAYRDLYGKNVLIRTVTMIYTGRVSLETQNELILSDAAWIPETNRWSDSLRTCKFAEVEPYLNDVVLNKGAFLDVTEIDKLPLEQK